MVAMAVFPGCCFNFPHPGPFGAHKFASGERRITVYDVLDCMSQGMTEPQIIEDYPELTVDDIRACLAFAAQRERQLTAVYSSGQ